MKSLIINLIPKLITPALRTRLKIFDFQDTNIHLKINIGIKFLRRLGKVMFLLIVSACFSSCSGLAKNEEITTKIRIVDIAGKPKSVKLYVPESNIQILASQGMKINQATGELLIDQPAELVKKAPDSFTQPTPDNSRVVNASPVAVNNIQSSIPVSQAVAIDLAGQKLSSKSVKPEDMLVQEPDVEYDMSDSSPEVSKKEVSKVADVDKKQDLGVITKKFKVDSFGKIAGKPVNTKSEKNKKKLPFGTASRSGRFIQVGSFSTVENANKALVSAQKIAQAKIKQIDSNDKRSYRVLIGPISDQKKVKILLQKAVRAGYKDAFLTND